MSDRVTTPQPDAVRALLEASFGVRGRRLGRREVQGELTAGVVFLVLAGLLLALAPGGLHAHPALLVAVPAYAAASRVGFSLGAGHVVPTEPLLVVLFGLAAPQLVPLLVLAGLLLARGLDTVQRREHPERALFAGGDALHALGPALVLVLAGGVAEATPLVVAAAFAAQALTDLVASVARERWCLGVRPQLQARVLGVVVLVDLALLPLGLLALHAGASQPLAVLGLVPFLALLARWARHRERSVEQAHARLEALERERRRLRVAVRRIGEAFAANLDLDALLQVVARASADALDASDGRAGSFAGDGRAVVRRAVVGDGACPAAVLEAAEAEAVRRPGPGTVHAGGWAAAACRIGSTGEGPAGVVVVARAGAPFDEADAALLAYLCEQAGVAAGNALRHEVLHRQALTDELTGLANHRRFQEVLTATVERHRRAGAPAAVVLLDIDDFKTVNDVHGHHVGDEVLRAVGRAMRAACRASDEPARYGGEELAVVLPEASPRVAAECAERLRVAIEDLELVVAGVPLHVTASLGVAALGGPLTTKAALLAAADNALYRAKAAGKNRVEVAAPGRPAALAGIARAQRSAAEADLRRALDAGELFLEYQPIVDLVTAEPAAVEALVRWRHPSRGILAPREFVPLAERRGLIVPLGEWVLGEATRQAAEWAQARPDLAMHVNVSLPQLSEDGFEDQVAAALAASGLRPEALVLELTESILARDVDRTARRLGGLRDLGLRVAVDDFGTGHSSLQDLLRLPLDVVKLPIDFTEGIDRPGAGRTLALSILELAHRQGLAVVAEGIERPAQRDRLEAAGCALGQGFLFGAGAGPDALARRLARPALAAA